MPNTVGDALNSGPTRSAHDVGPDGFNYERVNTSAPDGSAVKRDFLPSHFPFPPSVSSSSPFSSRGLLLSAFLRRIKPGRRVAFEVVSAPRRRYSGTATQNESRPFCLLRPAWPVARPFCFALTKAAGRVASRHSSVAHDEPPLFRLDSPAPGT